MFTLFLHITLLHDICSVSGKNPVSTLHCGNLFSIWSLKQLCALREKLEQITQFVNFAQKDFKIIQKILYQQWDFFSIALEIICYVW